MTIQEVDPAYDRLWSLVLEYKHKAEEVGAELTDRIVDNHQQILTLACDLGIFKFGDDPEGLDYRLLFKQCRDKIDQMKTELKGQKCEQKKS